MKSVYRLPRYFLRSLFLLIAAAAVMLAGSAVSIAAQADLEKDLQASLEKSRQTASTAAQKLALGKDISPELVMLKTLSENIHIAHMLIEERFRLREEKIKTLGSSALSRQQAMAEGYRKALTEYLGLIDTLPSDASRPSTVDSQRKTIDSLKTLLDKLLPKKKHPLIGSLPYKHLNYPASEPTTAAAITPAYKGGNKTVSPDDTKAAPEAPISKEIAALAQSLNWNPVSIYEYVKNNVETEWYWGCMKGAEDTLHQKSGNDCDQAALLVALLRASLYPTRYVRGEIEFFPDIERAKNLTGIDDPAKIAEFFQKAGIPYTPVIAGGKIANFQIEHIWVETHVPYSNYRGSIIDEHGKAWLGLDTSIKVKGYEYRQTADSSQHTAMVGNLSRIRDEYLGFVTAPTSSTPLELNKTPLEYLQSSINSELITQNSELAYADFLRTRVLIPENMKILPASLQFGQVKVTNEYTTIPDDMKHKVRFSAISSQQSVNGSKLLEITLDVLKLSNQQITLSYEPETVQDQEIINSFGGLDNTPAYLVRLRPVLKVNGERVVVGTDGLPMGADYTLTIDLTSPSGTETISNTLIVGNLTVIGITAQKAVITPSPLAEEGGGEGSKDAERILYETANHYIDRWNASENEFASLLHLSIARPIPTVVTLGGLIDVTYLLDMPHGFTWKGVYLDADVRRIETVRSAEFGVGNEGEREKLFMQLSSLQGSVLEHKLFEDDFKVESISTAKLFQLVNSQPGTSILTIDKTNIETILPTLDFADNIKEDIINSVNQGQVVRIPQLVAEFAYHDWSGIGYIKENPGTGESGWMMSGMLASSSPDLSGIAGGSTVDAEWLNNLYLQQTLSTPYAGAVNHNPLAGVRLYAIPATDKQDPKTVGTSLFTPFAAAVLDGKDLPVVGATVTFRIIAGGGTIQCLNQTGGPAGPPSESLCDAQTSNAGIAKARLTLGKETGSNPIYMSLKQTDVNSTQVGLNLVEAYVIGWGGQVALNHPFEAYGLPDVYGSGKKIETVFPRGSTGTTVVNDVTISNTVIAQTGMPNNPGGSLLARLKDQYGNPISNAGLQFNSLLMTSQTPTVPLPESARKIQFFDATACTVAYPLYGECNPYAETTTAATDYNGGMTNFVYGNTVNTAYTIVVTSPTFTNVPPVAWTMHIGGYADSQDNYYEPTLEIGSLDLYSANGDLVNAAKAGEELKAYLKAKLYLIKTDFTVDNAIESCLLGSMQVNCQRVRPKGTILTEPFSHGLVTFKTAIGNGVPSSSEAIGNGLYQAKFRTDTMPEKNIIEAWGETAVSEPVIFYDDNKGYHVKLGLQVVPIMLKTGQSAYPDKKTGIIHAGICRLEYNLGNGTQYTVCFDSDDPMYLQKTNYTAFGIGVDTVVEPSIVLLDDSGRTTVDTTIKYTVRPAEYKAEFVDIDLLKTINNNTDVWMDVLDADQTQGQGSAAIVKGSKADVDSLYKAQVVMNRGSVMEVKGDKKDLPFAELRVLTDEAPPKLVEEIKFGSGRSDRPEKIYLLELISPALIQKCNSLSGKISALSKNGQSISLPVLDGQTYAAEYGMQFYKPLLPLENNKCLAQIVDSLDSGSLKDKFIVSNRTRADLSAGTLNTNLFNKAVLYGGIGNRLSVTVSELKKDISIEPVGVVILGIDGLRQDVLYTPEEQQVNPSGTSSPYYVAPTHLKGLCDVLGGASSEFYCDLTGIENRHINLQNVTTIFPSITFAAWASIFTGKQPKETGILGNEFFARDILTSNQTITGLQMLPSGMITLDADGGAFRPLIAQGPYSWLDLTKSLPFILHHVMPAEFAGFNHNTTTDKISLSAPNGALQNGAIPLWDDINKMVNSKYLVSENPSTKCINSKSECRTVSIFNQYARNADWWGTPSTLTGEMYSAITSVVDGAKTMDKSAAVEAAEFIKKYFANYGLNENDKRKRFPAVFSVYLSGLDHEAHVNGLSGYKNYFTETVDVQIKSIVATLKGFDEFDNKMFIIVSDHGETQMPVDLKYEKTEESIDIEGYALPIPNLIELPIDMSCSLKTNMDNEDVQLSESANNNIHIWELGEIFYNAGDIMSDDSMNFSVMAPQEIANQYDQYSYGAKPNTATANIIAALNGPIAHIYLKNRFTNSWSTPRIVKDIGYVAEILRLSISTNKTPSNLSNIFPVGIIEDDVPILSNIDRLTNSVDFILVRRNNNYEVFYGIKPDGSDILSAPLDNYAEFGSFLYAKALKRIANMNHPERSGDIVLVMRDFANGDAINRFTTAYACKAWHGSLNPSDSYVPLVIAYPGGNNSETDKLLQSVSACSNGQCEGNWNVTEIIKTIIDSQYVTP